MGAKWLWDVPTFGAAAEVIKEENLAWPQMPMNKN